MARSASANAGGNGGPVDWALTLAATAVLWGLLALFGLLVLGCGADRLRALDETAQSETESSCDGSCDDGDPCTHDDLCDDDVCAGTPYDCDDGDPCTVDRCDGEGGCVRESNCPDELPPEITEWVGWYDCPLAQGKTSLSLSTTRDVSTNNMAGIFIFSAHPENPTLPTGSWHMEGAYFPDENTMELLPSVWIEQPLGWLMVGMRGAYDQAMQQIHGYITLDSGEPNPFCETFDLDRVF